MLEALAEVEMHAIQTSGNTVRNVTADHFAGAAADEIADPRPCGRTAAPVVHRPPGIPVPAAQIQDRRDRLARTTAPSPAPMTSGCAWWNRTARLGFEIIVGGGLGRTPVIGTVIKPFLPRRICCPTSRRSVASTTSTDAATTNTKPASRSLLHETGARGLSAPDRRPFAQIRAELQGADRAILAEIKRALRRAGLTCPHRQMDTRPLASTRCSDRGADTNLADHKQADHVIARQPEGPWRGARRRNRRPDARVGGCWREAYGHGELRISHEQNVILPHVHKNDFPRCTPRWRAGLATANIGLASDIIACPGMDYCALATARSIPVAQEIAERIEELKLEHEVGALKIKISGCINACGHHHVGHIGILGLDRAGVENYQITLGGDHTEAAAIGERAGPGFPPATRSFRPLNA